MAFKFSTKTNSKQIQNHWRAYLLISYNFSEGFQLPVQLSQVWIKIQHQIKLELF